MYYRWCSTCKKILQIQIEQLVKILLMERTQLVIKSDQKDMQITIGTIIYKSNGREFKWDLRYSC